jgi:hypothetical protein
MPDDPHPGGGLLAICVAVGIIRHDVARQERSGDRTVSNIMTYLDAKGL